jgi:glycosyltransferase involved in cell wall biosynthesis
MMRVLVATDAWHPQVNGVVRTLTAMADNAARLGSAIVFATPDNFSTVPLPGYAEIRVALPWPGAVRGIVAAVDPDAIHIATEGPVGLAFRHYCVSRGSRFTTSFHTRFPEYVAARTPLPESAVWAYLRWFHGASEHVMAPTPTIMRELAEHGMTRLVHWSRGVDTVQFRPQPGADLGLPRPVFLSVGRIAVEKNLDAFLALDLPGSKVVVGDGPALAGLSRQYPDTVFLGRREGAALAAVYAAADCFVFPSRTDTFGLVLLEALASGLPVAAFPVATVRDVLGSTQVSVLDDDLRAACLAALALSRDDCRAFAQGWSWQASARRFIASMVDLDADTAGRLSRHGGGERLPAGQRGLS